MDPWQATTSINTPTPTERTEGAGPVELLLGFENSFISDSDSFDAATRNQALIHKTPVSFEKLPDSEEYLARLETKLGKLRVGGNLGKGKAIGSRRKEEEGLVLELSAAREAALVQFVGEQGGTEGRSEEEISGEREVTTNYIARRLQPVQPVTEGEVVVLTKSDSLAVDQEEGEEGGERSEEVCEN